MTYVLREYQINCVEALWNELYNNQVALCSMPTGSGKTLCFIELIDRAIAKKLDLQCVVLVNKINLLTQTYKRFVKHFGMEKVSVFYGKEKRINTITIACIQSISDFPFEKLNLIILDETHNVDENDGRYINFIRNNPSAKVLAFTATPFRSSSGLIYGNGKLFRKITYQKKLKEMIDEGYLVEPRLKRVEHQFDISSLRIRAGEFMQEDVTQLVSDTKKVRAQLNDAIPRLKDRKSIVWACALISHAIDVCLELELMGENAVVLHSKMEESERLEAQRKFESGEARHLVFVSIVSEGYDFPPIDAVILMRPMRSPVLYVQTVGRGLRTSPGKTDCLVLDYGKVIETIGPLDNPRLNDKESRKKSKNEPSPMKFCPNCLEYIERKNASCPVCEHEFFKPVAPVLTVKPYQEGALLSNGIKPQLEMNVRAVYLDSHTSKNGNDCLKIMYMPESIEMPVTEFFVCKNDYAQQRLLKRLIEMDIDLKSSLDEQVQMPVKKVPKKIIYEMEGKYPRIKRLVFV